MAVTAVTALAAATGASVAVAAPGDGGSATPTANSPGLHYGITKRACGAASAGKATCFAVQRVPVAKGTAGAEPYTVSASYAVGPNGGYTPADLQTAYGLTSLPADAGTGQTVAVVDAYNNPNVLADLNAFDSNYGLGSETASSFQVLNQSGATSPLPADDTAGWSVEESLDVDAVRAICENCKILLVETNSNSNVDLAAGVAAAAAAGATEISNSYGGPEGTAAWTAGQKSAKISAYNYPGVVVTASTGDDGWYGWDFSNTGSSQNSPETPATVPGVVAVGGTSLVLNSDGTRNTEAVWNENGPEDSQSVHYSLGRGGGSGGGCSKQFTAEPWQSSMTGFSTTGCGTARLAADVSALADPYTGFDIYDSYNCGSPCGGAPMWATYGGTSLASPLVAAMWALAGGAGGVSYPSLSLYGHASAGTTHLYDVTKGYEASVGVLSKGGNDWCDGDNQTTCAAATNTGFGTTNPNGRGKGMLACGFDSGGATVANDTQCRAVAGFDGPTGVGAPSGVNAFTPMTPTPAFTAPTGVTPGVATGFNGSATDPFPGGTISSYSWHWGDGSSDSTGASPVHTFATAGTYTVELTATDSYGQVGSVSHDVTVGTAAPTVTSISPSSGPTAGGTTVTINGSGFTNASKVTFGSAGHAPSFTVNSDTEITAVAPPGATGLSVHVTVTTPGGTSPKVTADIYKYTAPAPAVTSISPTSGPMAGGNTVTINGSGFTGTTKVTFGSAGRAPSYTVVSDAKITAVAPATTTAGLSVHITVTTAGGTSPKVSADIYRYAPVPTVSSVSPNTGPAAGGATVTITGSGFTGATKVTFGSAGRATSYTVVSDSTITAVAPAGSNGLSVHVTVTTPGGTSTKVTGDIYKYA